MPNQDTVVRLNAALEGRYRIERQLGEGGMATVYLARDEKHNRNVALKVLKPELAAVVGAERFLAEIETTANLQHPHILPLFDSGEADGFLFYVMPYVEGESLRERLDREHQLPVDEAVQIATNVAEALDYAHRQGVIHRDIKPANILLQDGKPVVSDFGIALALGAAGAGRLTETGLSLGTPHYMSPEQATGDLHVGAATDIYALGCVLYEMLVAEPPYTGGTPQAVLGKIVTGEPAPVAEHRSSVPPNVDAAVRMALEKVPADRFGSARAFASALTDPGFRHGDVVAVHAGAGLRRWSWLTAPFAATTVLFAGIAGWSLTRAERSQPVSRFELTLPLGVAYTNGMDITADGRTLVFADYGGGRLYRRDLSQPDAVPIPGAENVWNPFLSPDGEWVAYFDQADAALKKIRLDGGGAQTLAPAEGAYRSGGWGPDGTIIFGSATIDGLAQVSQAGGPVELVPNVVGDRLRWPELLPDGHTVLAQSDDGEVVAVSLVTGERSVIASGTGPRYAGSGHVIYWSDGSLWAVPFDAGRLEATGEPTLIAQDVFANTSNGYAFFAVGGNLLAYEEGTDNTFYPVWLSRDGPEEALDPRLGGVFGAPAISPDGRKIAFEYNSPGDGTQDIWVYERDQETFSRLTFDGELNRYPFWSLDGQEVGFSSDRDGLAALYAVPADLSGGVRLLLADPDEGLYEGGWTPAGELVYRRGSTLTNGFLDVWRAEPPTNGIGAAIVETPASEQNPAISPDGRWLAYVSDESGQNEVYVRPYPGPGGRRQISTDRGRNPVWAHHSQELFYLSEDPAALIVASYRTEPGFVVESREELLQWDLYNGGLAHPEWDVAPNDERILAIGTLPQGAGRQILVQNFSQLLQEGVSN